MNVINYSKQSFFSGLYGKLLHLDLLHLSVSNFYTNNYLTSDGTGVCEIVGLLEKDKLNQALLLYKGLNLTLIMPTLILSPNY